ncbi:MAG: radical SAM protein [Gammaproteobacteria bacterium]|nr:radical SAM protein [Gammaproteobacteria bacterium]
MKPYKIAVNMEWTSKCNARCVMCPQHLIGDRRLMAWDTFRATLDRLSPTEVFRVVVAGYGEPTTHPRFMDMVSAIGDHPVRFDMVSNGQELNLERLKHLDGRIALMIVSFSSIDPDIYGRVHVKLDHERVKENIRLAQKTFTRTRLGISLTPLAECLNTLPQTIGWLRDQGVTTLTMSPTLYNRGGTMQEHEMATRKLRAIIAEYGLRSQELDFIPSLRDITRQYWSNRFKCVPRNSDLFITSGGDYLYCYNDIGHRHRIGHVRDMGLRQALALRERSLPIEQLCKACNMRGRYGPMEIVQVGAKYLAGRAAAFAGRNG